VRRKVKVAVFAWGRDVLRCGVEFNYEHCESAARWWCRYPHNEAIRKYGTTPHKYNSDPSLARYPRKRAAISEAARVPLCPWLRRWGRRPIRSRRCTASIATASLTWCHEKNGVVSQRSERLRSASPRHAAAARQRAPLVAASQSCAVTAHTCWCANAPATETVLTDQLRGSAVGAGSITTSAGSSTATRTG
jgi:hypothetical protein